MEIRPLPDAALLYEHAACALLLTDDDGTILRANATFGRWTGHDARELVLQQRKLQELLGVGARIFHQTHWAPLLRMQGTLSEVKLDLVCSDGRALPILMNAVRREHAVGIFLHELALFAAPDRDRYERELVLARRRADELLASERSVRHAVALAQARLQLALDSAGLMVWQFDPANGERHYDDRVALLLGHAAPAHVPHTAFAAAIDAADREREARSFDAALASAPPPQYVCSYRLNGVDGRQRVIRSTGRGVSGGEDVPWIFVGVLQDVTETVGLRAAAEDRALFAEQMVGIVSHDLRNPLAAIQMSTRLLERAELTPKQRTVLGRITTSVQRAQRLINDLLDFTASRIGAGLPVARAPIELQSVLRGAVEELAAAFDGRAQLRYRHDGAAGGLVLADADRLVQALGNLVANAVSYGSEGTPVRIASRIGPDGDVSISVHNEGPPIEPGRAERMFDPMTRYEAGDSNPHSVGLGLYIVRQIAIAHSGEVGVSSSADDGTTFTIRIPRP